MRAERSESERLSVTRNGLHSLLVGQYIQSAGPVRAPHATVEAKSVENLGQRLPYVRVGKGLLGQGAGPGNLDGYVVARGQRKHVRQIAKDLRRRGRVSRRMGWGSGAITLTSGAGPDMKPVRRLRYQGFLSLYPHLERTDSETCAGIVPCGANSC